MKQSTVIFGVLLFAFLMYITLRGQLPAYLALFKGKVTGSATGSSSNVGDTGAKPAGTNIGNILGDISFDHGVTWQSAGTMASVAEVLVP